MRAVRERLRAMYGIPVMEPHGDPIGELVLTVLSQSTNDRNRDVAFLRLRDRFDAWEAVRDAPVEEIEEAIRPGGISKVKSVRIKAMLEAIGDPLDLSWMRDAPVAESQAYLRALPGVGRKTAACVLLFSYGLRDVPVDTHVSRVGMRLHLLEPGAPSTACTTRCWPSRRPAPSSSSTSTCCATAGARATPSARRAACARSGGCARRGANSAGDLVGRLERDEVPDAVEHAHPPLLIPAQRSPDSTAAAYNPTRQQRAAR